jgi:hypothetical protein
MLRFTIRDVLWLTVVVAVALGWWIEHRRFEAYSELVRSLTKWTPAGPGAHQTRSIVRPLGDDLNGVTQP